jgi:hypothetical protein
MVNKQMILASVVEIKMNRVKNLLRRKRRKRPKMVTKPKTRVMRRRSRKRNRKRRSHLLSKSFTPQELIPS